jgi:CBS domain-containing membrane protein
MNSGPARGPQHTLIFRAVALVSRLRLNYLQSKTRHREIVTAVYLFMAGVTALSTIAATAYLVDFMLLFPPLGPSAFILFYTPLAESASPRSLILGHTVSLLSGLGALVAAQALFPGLGASAPVSMNWSYVTAVALAMGAASIAMVALKCVHPPAAATALIAAMGYLENIVQVCGVLAAVLFLAVEAYLFNRLMGGLPYPIWRSDPHIENIYHSLAGRSSATISRWQNLANKTFQRR